MYVIIRHGSARVGSNGRRQKRMTNALAYYMVESLKSFKLEAPNQFLLTLSSKNFQVIFLVENVVSY